MNCQFCGSQLPKEAHACPNCGTRTPTHDAQAYHATVPSAQLQRTDISNNSTPYTDPYNPSNSLSNSLQEITNPYSNQSNPYRDISTTSVPPPPITPNRKKPVLISVSVFFLILLAIVATTWIYWRPPIKHTTTPTTPASPISVAKGQSLYDQTTQGTPKLNDTLAGPDNYGWDNYSQGGNTSCSFSDAAYHAKANPTYFSPCYAKATNFSDFIFQVQITIVSGHSGGIIFRADSTNDKAYRFRISTDGTYILDKFFLGSQGQPQSTVLASGQSSLIVTGANQPNLVSATAQGTSIYLSVNHKYLDHASDSTYQSGQVGVYTDSDTTPVDAMFRNAQVWKL